MYEYGIRQIVSGEMHRTDLTAEEAAAFMDPKEWGDVDASRVFEVVRRPVSAWQTVPDDIEPA